MLKYLGGKSRLAKSLVKNFPEHTCYCEPFCGALWVLLAKKQQSKREVVNDLDSELITFWRVVQNHPEAFIKECGKMIHSRELFFNEKTKNPNLFTDIQRAARYFYLQKTSFGGKTTNRSFGTSATKVSPFNKATIKRKINEITARLELVTIENIPAFNCIEKYDRKDTFFYIDPPYFNTAGYVNPFPEIEYKKLSKILKNIDGKFMLSLNNHPFVRDTFSAFNFESTSLRYSVGNSRTSKATRSELITELIITNY